jgi:hypothetical protein
VSEDTIETVRVCRECGEEYRPDVLVCADCGGELETRRADEPLARLYEQSASVEGGPARYLILVKEGEAAAALQSLAELIAPHETGGDMRAIETAFDPERGYLQCPACATKMPADAKECPECGLGFASE